MTLRKFFGLGSKSKLKKPKTRKELILPDNFIIGSTAGNRSKIGIAENAEGKI